VTAGAASTETDADRGSARISRLRLDLKDRAALQFEAIMSLKISHLKIPEVLKAIM